MPSRRLARVRNRTDRRFPRRGTAHLIIHLELPDEFLILEKVREQVGVVDLERGDRRWVHVERRHTTA